MHTQLSSIKLDQPHTVFLSDVHLDARDEETAAQLFAFLEQLPESTERLYIVGDLFEAWIGDDAPGPIGDQVILSLSQLKRRGIEVFFTHGNRDFLVGDAFANSAGVTLLDETCLIDCYGTRVLLLHGDTLCTDDIEYQKLRMMVRDPQWQDQILALPIAQRIELAQQLRTSSAEQMQHKSEDIMDVNQAAVEQALNEADVSVMLHGHTHRPNVHTFSINNDDTQQSTEHHFTRIVLGDWYTQGSVLYWSDEGYALCSLPR